MWQKTAEDNEKYRRKVEVWTESKIIFQRIHLPSFILFTM